MAELGIGAYRFSIAWPRILPEGGGAVNQRGLDHYRRVVEALHRHGVTPVATLYHWDLPQALEDLGGWANRDTAFRFAEYAAIVHGALAGEVPLWTTINEPWVAAWLGYGTGVHAPGKADDALALAASHHLLLAHGLAVEAMDGDDAVGITLNLQPTTPASDDAADVLAARRADLHMNAYYLDPIFGRGYPDELVEFYRPVTDMAFVHDGDLDVIAAAVRHPRRELLPAVHGHGGSRIPRSRGAAGVARRMVDRPRGRRGDRDGVAGGAGRPDRSADADPSGVRACPHPHHGERCRLRGRRGGRQPDRRHGAGRLSPRSRARRAPSEGGRGADRGVFRLVAARQLRVGTGVSRSASGSRTSTSRRRRVYPS